MKGRKEFTVEPRSASGCVVVFHEVWGLVEHTEDVCKRLSKLGFAATAPNLYSEHSELLTPDRIQKAMEGVWELSLDERRNKTKVAAALDAKGVGDEVRKVASVLYDPAFRDSLLQKSLAAVEQARSRYQQVTTLGFCMGGGLSLRCAAKSRKLTSAISFYGQSPPGDDVPDIGVPVLDVHAHQDELINNGVPAFVNAMLENGKDLTLKIYPRTKHGFFNDTRAEVYERDAANDAWDLTRWFLERSTQRH